MKEKARKSNKPGGGKDRREKEAGLVNRLERVHPFEGNGDIPLSNLPNDDKLSVSTSADDSLETKMVDPTSYTIESSTSISGSKDGSTTSESTICSTCKEPDSKNSPGMVTDDNQTTSKSIPDSEHEEQRFSVENFRKSGGVDINPVDTKVEDTFSNEVLNKAEALREETTPGDSPKLITSSASSVDKDGCHDQERSSPTKQPVRVEPDTESGSCLQKREEPDALTDGLHLDCLSSESNDTHPGKNEDGAKTRFTQSENGNGCVVDQALSDISSGTITVIGGDDKSVSDSPCQERADALESLLELCAQLLKQDKLEELAGVLKPFGGEAVSSRETAIWLTKSLMSAQKFNTEP